MQPNFLILDNAVFHLFANFVPKSHANTAVSPDFDATSPGLLSQASAEAADLLRRMLVTDPAERVDVAAVMEHSWFQRDLNPRLAALNDALLTEHSTWPLLCRSCATSNEVRVGLGALP